MSAFKIITGIGRSGTSVVAEYAKRCGINIGQAKWLPQYDAGNEDREFISINQHLYKKGIIEIVQRIKYFDRQAAKDPLFIRDNRILKYWWATRKDFEIIYCKRDFNEIMLSQMHKPDMMCPAYRCFPEIMQQREESFLNLCGELGVTFHIINYGDTDYKQINKALGIKNNGEIWKDLIY